ncbi:DUF3426 domain-containing protein [Nitratidesulfovibrio termitidis]|uniref:DUF3426 domain-containing protein n=1 Tax=Nitratidesulfovibrio termitidis TaxID=42252 RepID=UPI0004221CAB|nr:DUF3426 domain-containing protein [Nitratidesulfovibrio termitidis]
MIVICPSCSTKYNLPDDRARPGAKLKCTLCKSVFPIESATPPSAGAPDFDAVMGGLGMGGLGMGGPDDAAASDTVSSNGAELDHGPFDVASDPEADLAAAVRAKVQADARKRGSADDGPDVSDIIGSMKGYNLDDAPPAVPPKKYGWPVIAGFVAVLLAVAVGVTLRFTGMWPGDKAVETPPPAVNGTEQIKNIALRNYRQYYVNNEKVGQVAVIEGKVVNNFSSPRELMKIEASLYDAAGTAVVTKQQLCGVTVSLFQLQVLGEQELETALNNKIEILTNNTNVPPGGEVPFMVVFYNPPASVAEFGVKVVEARIPPDGK